MLFAFTSPIPGRDFNSSIDASFKFIGGNSSLSWRLITQIIDLLELSKYGSVESEIDTKLRLIWELLIINRSKPERKIPERKP